MAACLLVLPPLPWLLPLPPLLLLMLPVPLPMFLRVPPSPLPSPPLLPLLVPAWSPPQLLLLALQLSAGGACPQRVPQLNPHVVNARQDEQHVVHATRQRGQVSASKAVQLQAAQVAEGGEEA